MRDVFDKLYVVTGNPNKAKNSLRVLRGLFGDGVAGHISMDLPELQSLELKEIVANKLQFAIDNFSGEVSSSDNAYLVVEDISLEFSEMGKLPGTFIKFFVKELGLQKMCDMVVSDRSATIKCVIGLIKIGDSMANAKFFSSELKGTISREPKGEGGFGFDKIFIPNGFGGGTAGELSDTEYERYFAEIRKYNLLVGS